MAKKICAKCSTELLETLKFCPNCGCRDFSFPGSTQSSASAGSTVPPGAPRAEFQPQPPAPPPAAHPPISVHVTLQAPAVEPVVRQPAEVDVARRHDAAADAVAGAATEPQAKAASSPSPEPVSNNESASLATAAEAVSEQANVPDLVQASSVGGEAEEILPPKVASKAGWFSAAFMLVLGLAVLIAEAVESMRMFAAMKANPVGDKREILSIPASLGGFEIPVATYQRGIAIALIILGALVAYLIVSTIRRRTARKWGMSLMFLVMTAFGSGKLAVIYFNYGLPTLMDLRVVYGMVALSFVFLLLSLRYGRN